jgi:flavin-dependent dehydrogenase
MPEIADSLDQFILDDGARIAVIGGGPTGSFFSIFALKMAKMVGKKLAVTVFEPKDFCKDGPIGCNRCGGIISELLVQTLAVEGINLPDSVVRKGINSYNLHTDYGDVFIATPDLEKTIATVYRGGGPKGFISEGKESFDHFLLKQAIHEGATHQPLRIDRIETKGKKPVLYSKQQEISEFDLVVGAFGVNSTTPKIFEEAGFGYKEPPTVTTAIAELRMGEDIVSEFFGNSVHLFLLPDKGMKFAAMIPKGSYVTLCILGKEMNTDTVPSFLDKPVVKRVLKSAPYSVECRCLPKMNVGAPEKPFADRIVMCGDAGSTRLFKDGLGAAYLMGKAAAKTAVFEGVSRQHFTRDYYPVYKSIVVDNQFGKFLFTVTDIFRKNKLLTQGMLGVVRKEQAGNSERVLSSILWNMFTGNERYKNVFPKSFDVRMNLHFVTEFAKILSGRTS